MAGNQLIHELPQPIPVIARVEHVQGRVLAFHMTQFNQSGPEPLQLVDPGVAREDYSHAGGGASAGLP